MRLAESKIIAGLGDPSVYVREVVAQYLEDCGRTQVDITRELIAAVERFGWEEAFEFPHRIASFELDAATMEWAIGEIERQGEGAPPENMRWHLAHMIADAPIDIVRPQLARILALDTMSERRTRWQRHRRTNADHLELRNRLFKTSPEECWKLLDQHCRELANKEETSDAEIAYANALVERIAAGGQLFADRVGEILEQADIANGYQEWLTGLAIDLAGKLRLESAAELIFQKFDFDFDWYNEAIANALNSIGTPTITALVRDRYAGSPWHVRLYSTDVFESVHHDRAVDDILQLTPREQDDGLRCHLGVSLASHFDDRGIAPALAVYREDTEDVERFTIIERLFAHASLGNLALPELASWEEQLRARWEKFRESRSETDQMIESALIDDDWTDEDDELWDKDPTETIWPGTSPHGAEGENAYKLRPIVRAEPRIGRNERCQCGSGKKYKSCCLRNAPK